MSELLNKSNLNKEAADLLIDNHVFAPSIHCSYYGLLQTAKYVLKVDYLDNTLGGPESHQTIRKKIRNLLRSKSLKNEAKRFNGQFQVIKDLRILSDYSDDRIIKADAEKARSRSKELIDIVLKLR